MKIISKFLIGGTICLLASSSLAQSQLTAHTLRLDRPENAAVVKIEELAWLTGRWVGEGFGGTLEETWNPPMAGSMVATFRMISEGKPDFYEICLIAPDANSLTYKVKHFNADLTGWEEKDHYISFPLIRTEPGKVYFQGLTMVLDGDACTHYLAMKQKDGSYKEATLVYRRSPANAPDEPKITINNMKLGAFSMSLNVKDIRASKQFYEQLGFTSFGGNIDQNWVILKNGNALIGLFQGMFEGNLMTFNPGWDENAQNVDPFDDVRAIQQRLKAAGIALASEADAAGSGPAHFVVKDPDGNVILIDQHR